MYSGTIIPEITPAEHSEEAKKVKPRLTVQLLEVKSFSNGNYHLNYRLTFQADQGQPDSQVITIVTDGNRSVIAI